MTRTIPLGIILISLAAFSNPAFSGGGPVAAVRTTTLKTGELASTITGYGIVSTDPRNTTAINFPYAAQITRLLITPGEVVRKGALLAEVAISPTDAQGFAEARSNLDFARSELARTETMAAQQLATRSQLDQARKNVADAERSLAVQQRLGTNRGRTSITAPFTGIVSIVSVAQGDRVSAGTTIIQLARRDRLRVVIGIEPEDMVRVRPGMPVLISSVFDRKAALSGRVAKVYGMVNPQTRLVDVAVALGTARGSSLVAGTRVQGVITLNRHKGFVVPRSAVLKDAGGAYIFVVRNGRAHRVAVTTGIESNGMVAIDGRITPGDRVVTRGNYELREGMDVREDGR